MACKDCHIGSANVFNEREANRQLRLYHKRGPAKTTRVLLDALAAEGVSGLTLLDIGGGIGGIALELFKSGVTSATEIDASAAFVALAQREATQQGVADRVVARSGDFVELAPETSAAGIVTLDRVICCYGDMPLLVGQSAAKATKLYGAVFPRYSRVAGLGNNVVNTVLRLMRNPFRLYLHPTAAVDAVIRGKGLLPRFHRNVGLWQVVVYARPA